MRCGSRCTTSTLRTLASSSAGNQRADHAQLQANEQIRQLVERFQSAIRDKVVPEFVCRTLDNINEPLSIEHAEKYEGLVNLSEPLDYFDYEPWMRNYLADASMQNPHHPLRFEGLSVRNRVKLVLAARWQKPEGDAMAEFKTRFGPFMKRYTPVEDGLIIELSVELPARVVPVADKAAFNRLIELTRSQASFRVSATEGNP